MRPAVSALCLLLAVALPCHAGDKPRPNTLTPKEIADGWILLFDGQTTFGWKTGFSSAKKELTVTDDALDLANLGDGHILCTQMFNEFELHLEYASTTNQAYLGFNAPMREDKITPRSVSHTPGKRKEWTSVKFRREGGKYEFDVAGSKSTHPWSGPAIIQFGQNTNANVKLRNIKLRPLNTQSIFNGKDLAGWKVFPGKKSTFAVNDKGELNVKDGPGDLQTVGKYKDFLLQLECISNGKHLNSGIFFRCRDNEYQNGYEAQIRNQFTKDATQKYLIEEYDPTTNKLLAKKEILSTAFDFGTGAIYRRVPARKEMAKDGEWFAITIVARGNHLATWVNGIQVTDWYDNRPKSDNARTGCKLEAGHISIQGHDPTTDLSFKNFRIVELK